MAGAPENPCHLAGLIDERRMAIGFKHLPADPGGGPLAPQPLRIQKKNVPPRLRPGQGNPNRGRGHKRFSWAGALVGGGARGLRSRA